MSSSLLYVWSETFVLNEVTFAQFIWVSASFSHSSCSLSLSVLSLSNKLRHCGSTPVPRRDCRHHEPRVLTGSRRTPEVKEKKKKPSQPAKRERRRSKTERGNTHWCRRYCSSCCCCCSRWCLWGDRRLHAAAEAVTTTTGEKDRGGGTNSLLLLLSGLKSWGDSSRSRGDSWGMCAGVATSGLGQPTAAVVVPYYQLTAYEQQQSTKKSYAHTARHRCCCSSLQEVNNQADVPGSCKKKSTHKARATTHASERNRNHPITTPLGPREFVPELVNDPTRRLALPRSMVKNDIWGS